eukprot:1115624-Pleurochrysis_carterae.AAC.1
MAIHLVVEFFLDCALPRAGLAALSSTALDSENILPAGSGGYSGVAKEEIVLAFVESTFVAAAVAFAGADAGCGRGTGTGVDVVMHLRYV